MQQTKEGLLVPPPEPPKPDLDKLKRTFENGARWFYWIAGLSLINSVLHLARSSFTFVIGLGITQIVDGIALGITQENPQITIPIHAIAVILNLLFAGVYVLFGWFAGRKHGWAFIVGMVLYVLDGLIFLLFADWLSFAFHVFAFVCIFSGYSALRKLNNLQSLAMPAQG